jgi:hypothetical protein
VTRPQPEKPLDGHAESMGHLRRLVAAKLSALVAEAERTEGRVAPHLLWEWRSLAGLLEAAERLRPASRSKRWPVALALALTLVVASVLLFVRVPQTEIELDASVDEFSFRLRAQQPLTEPLSLRFLGIAGIAGVDPSNGLDALGYPDKSAQRSPLAFYAAGADKTCQGGITVDGIVLPRQAQVRLRRSGSADRIQLSLKAQGAEIRATFYDCVMVGGRTAVRWGVGSPKTLTMQVGNDDLDLDIESAPDRPIRFAPSIPASDLSVTRIEHTTRGDVTLVRHLSSISAGQIFYESLNGEERKLRVAELLRFAHSDGEIRSIELAAGRLSLRFHGSVSGMEIGTVANARSLMPTWLKWLEANHSLALLWGSAMYAFGLVASLMKWWMIKSP